MLLLSAYMNTKTTGLKIVTIVLIFNNLPTESVRTHDEIILLTSIVDFQIVIKSLCT